MEGRVEHGDLPRGRECLLSRLDSQQVGGIVQRREQRPLLDLFLDALVDHDCRVAAATHDDAVSDGDDVARVDGEVAREKPHHPSQRRGVVSQLDSLVDGRYRRGRGR